VREIQGRSRVRDELHSSVTGLRGRSQGLLGVGTLSRTVEACPSLFARLGRGKQRRAHLDAQRRRAEA
jgi:hypothetical protein